MDGADLSTVKLKDDPHVTEEEQQRLKETSNLEYCYFGPAKIQRDHPDNLMVRAQGSKQGQKRKRQEDDVVCASLIDSSVYCVDLSSRR